MNKVLLVGRVGKTPDVADYGNGKKVVRFTLATTEFFGEKETTWHNIVIWGEYGEKMAKFIDTGSQIGVEGRIQTSAYEKQGVKCVSTTIVCDRVELLDSKKDNSGDSKPTYTRTEPQKQATSTPKATSAPEIIPNSETDDLPF